MLHLISHADYLNLVTVNVINKYILTNLQIALPNMSD